MIQDIKPGSQSTSPSLIILGQSIVYAEVVAKQTGPNRRNDRFSAPSDECLRVVRSSIYYVHSEREGVSQNQPSERGCKG